MKNIYLIPTDKPSRLIIYSTLLNEFRLLNEPIEDWKHKRHIYITNSEEIKDEEWGYNIEYEYIVKYDSKKHDDKFWYKKIILTTDGDLISDGVQCIDDEFLEWFVKNPSCEFVEVIKGFVDGSNYGYNFLDYKIIIPKEEKTFVELLDDSLSKTKVILEELKLMNAKREKLEEDTEKLKELWKISEDKDLGEFIKGGKYIQQDGVIILAGKNKTDGMVITDHKNTRGIGYYSDCWNPKAFKLYEEPKPYTKWEQDKDKYSEEDMIKFSSWILLQDITSRGEGNYVNTDGKIVTVKDLFEQFKKK
jgi:hypothetical protein